MSGVVASSAIACSWVSVSRAPRAARGASDVVSGGIPGSSKALDESQAESHARRSASEGNSPHLMTVAAHTKQLAEIPGGPGQDVARQVNIVERQTSPWLFRCLDGGLAPPTCRKISAPSMVPQVFGDQIHPRPRCQGWHHPGIRHTLTFDMESKRELFLELAPFAGGTHPPRAFQARASLVSDFASPGWSEVAWPFRILARPS
jgi:hypothetical protein